jgi:hypothetical protein
MLFWKMAVPPLLEIPPPIPPPSLSAPFPLIVPLLRVRAVLVLLEIPPPKLETERYLG